MAVLQDRQIIEALRQLEASLRTVGQLEAFLHAIHGILTPRSQSEVGSAPDSSAETLDRENESRDREVLLDRYLPANGSTVRRLRSSLMVTDVMTAFHGRPTTKKAFFDAFFKAFPAKALSAYWKQAPGAGQRGVRPVSRRRRDPQGRPLPLRPEGRLPYSDTASHNPWSTLPGGTVIA
ncbi:MAG: hypothetical protein ACRC20_09585 [Segniliparus sp.]|uniref:hypothetical protein n=1 Tax=Segniliparus sp. TaxID=2804064 RepID=UPI003F2B1A47